MLNMPFVLRRVPGEGEGEAGVRMVGKYLHGAMDGEAMRLEVCSPTLFEVV